MTWTTIPDGDIDPDSPITTSLVTALRDNVAAALAQDSGSPVPGTDFITLQSQMGSSVIGQGELKSTTGIVSTGAVHTVLTLPGGSYGFYPQIRFSTSSSTVNVLAAMASPDDADGVATASTLGTSYLTRITLGENVGGTIYAQQRYIQASPPYDLGDGDIALFVFAIVDNTTGDVEAVYAAPEAPWHYNGKTSIIATRKDIVSGKSYQKVKQIKAELMDTGKSIAQAVTDKTFTLDAIADRLINDAMVEVELTQAIKNADMIDIPHPFLGNNLTAKTVVMLDPVSTEKLLALHDAGEDLNTLIHDGTLSFDNIPLVRATPSGVMAVSFTL